jgi:hypothetical protein
METTVTPPETTVVPHSKETTVLPHSTDATIVPHSTETTVIPHSTETTVVPHPSETTVAPHPSETTVVPHSIETTVIPHSMETTVIPHPSETTVLPHSTDATIVPHSTETTVVPHSTETTVVPHPSETTVAPHPSDTTVIPHSIETSVYGDLRISPPTSTPLLGSSQPYHHFSMISGRNSEEMTVSQDMTSMTRSEKHFNSLRELIKCRMVSHNVTITQFSDVVTSLSADTSGDYSAFLKPLETVLFKVIHHLESLGAMMYYWHYLSYDMLEHVALQLNLDGVEPEMQSFKEDAEEFRRCTTMAAFSQTEKMKRVCPPLYSEIVTKLQWSETDTLRRLEEFRMAFLRNYQLNSFSMILGFVAMIEPSHSFNVTWFIPHVVTKVLTSPLPESLTTQYAVSNIVRDVATSVIASRLNDYVLELTELLQEKSESFKALSHQLTSDIIKPYQKVYTLILSVVFMNT